MAIFAIVVEERSFRGAAKRLVLSPSVVSHHVSLLEEHIGTPLLYRSTRSLSLTEAGRQMYKASRAMILSAEGGLDLFAREATKRLTDLRVAIPATLAPHPIFEKVTSFCKRYSGIRLTLSSSDTMLDLFKENFDIAIRMGKLEDSSLIAKRIGEDQLMVVAAPSYMETRPSLTHPNDLKSWDCIRFSPVQNEINLSKKGSKAKAVWGQSAVVVDSIEAMRRLAIAGVGLASLPRSAIEDDLRSGRLERLLPDWNDKTLGIYLVWAKNADNNEATRYFIDHMASK